MCGIVGVVAERPVVPLLMEGLRRLEYRGYDSAGLAVCRPDSTLARVRSVGSVSALAAALHATELPGVVGIAHTRWATHGVPSETNAHPHLSGNDIALVHNGIIENADELRGELQAAGFAFQSETDSEVLAHLIRRSSETTDDMLSALQDALSRVTGQYAIAVLIRRYPDRVFVARRGCPLLIGQGVGEHFIASDSAALLPFTRRHILLEEGDVAELARTGIRLRNRLGESVERAVVETALEAEAIERGAYRHYMQKEIFEQPDAIRRCLAGRIQDGELTPQALDPVATRLLAEARAIHLVACGTSYHAALTARYMIEKIIRIPCLAEQASEYRYRNPVVQPGTLLVTISQSGETADTLAALRMAENDAYLGTLSICNVAGSTLARESSATLMTRAGPEIGVASTKAFTTQLLVLTLMVIELARHRRMDTLNVRDACGQLGLLPELMEQVLETESRVRQIAERFVDKSHALFVARGTQYPIALEGALKLKEISYIHAEAYPAGELKHGPLALVEKSMPVIALAPLDPLLDKVRSNIQEIRARGGELFIVTDPDAGFSEEPGTHLLEIPRRSTSLLDPFLYTLPLQLLAYHVAVLRGTDVDKPRNLAKSVTVE